MYFKFFKRQYREKGSVEDRRRNCAVLPWIFFIFPPVSPSLLPVESAAAAVEQTLSAVAGVFFRNAL